MLKKDWNVWEMKKNKINIPRIVLYCAGIVIMSLGLALNVKSHLGVAPILTLPNILSEIVGWEFSNMLFVFYSLFIVLQIVLRRKNFKIYELLQFPVGLGITRLVALFTTIIPTSENTHLAIRIGVLVLAIVVTGIGVALSVDMKLLPNPADGLAAAVGEKLKKGLGFGKNIVDISSAVIALIISLIYSHSLGPVGIGTIAAGLLVGRMIAIFNKLFGEKLNKVVGLLNNGEEKKES